MEPPPKILQALTTNRWPQSSEEMQDNYAPCSEQRMLYQSLETVAKLLAPPKLEEVGLPSPIRSFDELVNSARLSVLSEEVNVFALYCICSFIRGRSYEKPLHTKLLEGTYRKYQTIWHQLLSYTYRLVIAR